MRADILQIVRKLPKPTIQQRQAAMGDVNFRGPWVHPDIPNYEFPSASALRKAFRIQRYGKNTLTVRNQDRLVKALRLIAVGNGIDFAAMGKSVIGDRVARLVMPDTTDLTGMLERIVREEVQNALKGTNKTQFVLKEHIKKIALEETKRLVLEELDFDVRVEGRVFPTKGGRRAVNLD